MLNNFKIIFSTKYELLNNQREARILPVNLFRQESVFPILLKKPSGNVWHLFTLLDIALAIFLGNIIIDHQTFFF